MVDVWSWICGLPESDEWLQSSDSVFFFDFGSNGTSTPTPSIQLRVDRTSGANSDTFMTFSVCLKGFRSFTDSKTVWVSNSCPLLPDKPFLPLVLQLLQEIISRSPAGQKSICPRSRLQKLKPDPISWIMDSHSPESFSSFFNLVFLIRLFWICACDAPSEVGAFYFQNLLSPHLEALSSKHVPVLRTFLISVGVDAELCFTRTLGYVIAKWLILREVGVGLQALTTTSPPRNLGFTYSTEAHGLWILKGHAPVMGMRVVRTGRSRNPKYQFPLIEAKESTLRYALAHQQLEAVVQFEYSVKFHDGYIHVGTRVDNLRFHVARLAFAAVEDVELANEKHFVSRIRVWVGPEVGATYVGGLTLGRSTENVERETKVQKIVKGRYGKTKLSSVKATARTSMRTKLKNWRWDQEAEGNAAVFEAVLCDNTTGHEAAMWKTIGGDDGDGESFQNRYQGTSRAFSKNGGVVFSGDEYGEEVGWRLSKEMEGSVLKWRIGSQIWLSYSPNEVKIPYFETRIIEWCDEVDLPLISTYTN